MLLKEKHNQEGHLGAGGKTKATAARVYTEDSAEEQEANPAPPASPAAPCGPAEINNGRPSEQLFFLKMTGGLEQTEDQLEQAQNESSACVCAPHRQTLPLPGRASLTAPL